MATSKKDVTPGAEKARLAVAAARRADRRKRIAIWSAVAAVGVALVAVTAILIGSAIHKRDAVAVEATGAIAGVTATSGLSANHVPNLPEPAPTNGVRVPPVGGDHDAVPQTCGVYAGPVGTWHAVHSLEHGAVWITYAPDLAPGQIATLAADAKGHDHVLVSPFPDQPSPVILTAWGLQLRVDSASDPRVEVFIAKYENGPQTPEPGAECSGTAEMAKP
jgi:Protein of unknown function (DUF3105)